MIKPSTYCLSQKDMAGLPFNQKVINDVFAAIPAMPPSGVMVSKWLLFQALFLSCELEDNSHYL